MFPARVVLAVLAALVVAASATFTNPVLASVNTEKSFTEDGLSVRVSDGFALSTFAGAAFSGNLAQVTLVLTVNGAPPPSADEGLVADLGASLLTQFYNPAGGTLLIFGVSSAATYLQVRVFFV